MSGFGGDMEDAREYFDHEREESSGDFCEACYSLNCTCLDMEPSWGEES